MLQYLPNHIEPSLQNSNGDMRGYRCADYEEFASADPKELWCDGRFDDSDFSVREMCTACGGGEPTEVEEGHRQAATQAGGRAVGCGCKPYKCEDRFRRARTRGSVDARASGYI